MQNSHENSIITAKRAVDLTTNQVKVNQKNPRIDVIRLGDWPFIDDYKTVMRKPKASRYGVYSDNMRAISRDMILPKDILIVEDIPIKRIIPKKFYIVSDIYGNTLLSKINKISPRKPLRLQNLNTAYYDTFLKRNEITSIALIYRIDRNVISPDAFKELFDEEYPFTTF